MSNAMDPTGQEIVKGARVRLFGLDHLSDSDPAKNGKVIAIMEPQYHSDCSGGAVMLPPSIAVRLDDGEEVRFQAASWGGTRFPGADESIFTEPWEYDQVEVVESP